MKLQTGATCYLTLKETAEKLRISSITVSRLIKNGQLEAYRFGNQYRIPKIALEEYQKQQKVN